MRIQGTAFQGGLAALGLVAAYGSWQREPEKAPGQVVVLDAAKADVQKVRFTDDKGFVELTRTGDDVWLRVSARGEGKLHTPERELRGNEQAAKLLEAFAPLRASRALGVPPKEKLVEYGLADEPAPASDKDKKPDANSAKADPKKPAADAQKKPVVKRRFEVTARGETRAFTVGGGAGLSPYVRDESDGKVYLLGGTLVSDLESAATRMVERNLHAFKLGDFDGVRVTTPDGKSRELVVVGDNPQTAKLAPAKSPDKPDEMAKSWADKVWRLFPIEVLGRGEQPAAGEPKVELRVVYTSHGRELGHVEVARVNAPAPANTSAPPAPPELYARTERTAGWVKLTTAADDVLREAGKIAAAE